MSFLGSLAVAGLLGHAGEATSLVRVGPESRVLRESTTPIGPDETVVEVVRQGIDETGAAVEVPSRYVTLATGLNRWDERAREWLAAVPEFEATAEGYFVARQTRTRLILPPDLSTEPVDMLGPDGVRLISAPFGLSVVDLSTGDTALLGYLQPCRAEQVAPDTVVFRNCLTRVRADLVFRISLAGMEQFLMLREWIPSLRDLEMDPAHVRLQFYTEFFEAPEPTSRLTKLKETDAALLRERVWEPDLTDRELTFGESTRMIPGRAFAAGDQNVSAPVAKSYEAVEERRFLVESCDYLDVAPWLEGLPAPEETVNYEGARLEPGQRVPANLPERLVGKPRWAGLPFEDRLPGKAWAVLGPETFEALDTGTYLAASGPGFVLDYTTINASKTNYTFRADETYYVTAYVYLYGTTTLEGGTVIKYAPKSGYSPQLLVTGPVDCKTDFYRPAILTAKDENTVGTTISGSSGTPSGSYAHIAFYCYYTSSDIDLRHLRVKHANYGFLFQGSTSNALRHAQFVDCSYPVYVYAAGTVAIHNLLVAQGKSGGAVFRGYSSTLDGQHITVHDASNLFINGGSATLSLKNSLLVEVDTIQSYTSLATTELGSSAGVFASVGEGDHYLAAGSPYRNVGTDQIDSALLGDLAELTTYAPLVYESEILTSATEWWPVVERDTANPDLGYHYPALDYAVNNLQAKNGGTLTIRPGTAVGVFGYLGLVAEDYGTLDLEGTATKRITLAHYVAVQEGTNVWGSAQYQPNLVCGPPHNRTSYAASPDLTLRFVDLSLLGGRGYGVTTMNGWYSPKTLSVRDCRFFGGGASIASASGSPVIELANNLFRRSSTSFYGWPALTAYNNLFWGAVTNNFNPGSGVSWSLMDNAFDHTAIGGSTTGISRTHNAYLGTVSPTPSGWVTANDLTVASFNYVSGALGEFYHSSTNLFDAGSRGADVAGLYHFTTQADPEPEEDSEVDIGFHYVATDGNGMPNDEDGDGVPDYVEDANGNGEVDSGETDWTDAQDLGVTVWISRPRKGPVP